MVHGDVAWWGQTISQVGSDEDRVSACLAETDISKFHWFCVGQKKQANTASHSAPVWSTMWEILDAGRIRGTVRYRLESDKWDAIVSAGLSLIYFEMLMLLTVRREPWQSHGNHRVLMSATSEL